MTRINISKIPYLPDSSAYFAAIRELPQSAWLDSGRPNGNFGRFDILTAAPSTLLETTNGKTAVTTTTNPKSYSDDNPFDLVAEHLQPLTSSNTASSNTESQAVPAELPFCGGALGYFAYPLANCLERLPEHARRDIQIPDMHVGLFDWSLLQDHDRQESWLVFLPTCPESLRRDIQQRVTKQKANEGNFSFNINELSSQINVEDYLYSFTKIQDYVAAGDCYQVNFSQRFSAAYDGDPFHAYRQLRRALPSPYSAFLSLNSGAILSHSPEQFLSVRDKQVITKPIKGTRPRHSDPKIDQQYARELLESNKDRAENLMIVDLLRNDLSKNCALGSVKAPKLWELESYANVHHLVSTVTGTLRDDRSPVDLLKGCFPGGSITGAPKVRAMQIIDELEPSQRSIYCGSIGYISSHGPMDSSIAIRTLACDDDRIYCWGGGGIVADSNGQEEYNESLAKIQILLDGLGKSSRGS